MTDEIQDVLKRVEERLRPDLSRDEFIKCWRKINLQGLNLSGLDLSNLDLSQMDFTKACLKDVYFASTNLTNAKFKYVDAVGADL